MKLLKISILVFIILSFAVSCFAVSETNVVFNVKHAQAAANGKTVKIGNVSDKKNGQFIFVVTSLVRDSVEVNLNIDGVDNPADYDLYVNRKFMGKLSKTQKLNIPKSSADQDKVHCLTLSFPKVVALYDRLSKSKDNDEQRAANTLSQAKSWIEKALSTEQRYISLFIHITPADKPVKESVKMKMPTENEAKMSIAEACWLLQQARARMYDVLKDNKLKTEVVYAMTPVEIRGKLEGKKLTVTVLNFCNLPLNGLLTPTAKTTPVKAVLTNIKGKKDFVFTLDEGSKPGAKVEMKFVQDNFIAKLTLPCLMEQ